MTVRRLGIAAAIVAFFSVASRLLGFAREAILLGEFGIGSATDSFASALIIVNSITAVLLYALVTVVIPEFQKERADNGERSAWRLAWALAAWVGMVLVVVAAVLALFPAVGTIPFRFDEGLAQEMEPLIRIMAPAVLLQGLSAMFTALLQIHGRFAGPAAIGVAFNAGIIVGILLLSGSLGIEAAAWGVMLGATLQIVLQMPHFIGVMRGVGVGPALSHPRLFGTAALAAPVFAASVVQQINNFTDKMFAATLEDGRIAALTAANTLGQAPRAIFLLPLMTPLFPLIARLVAEGRRDDAVAAHRRAAGILGVLSIPVGAFMALYANELIEIVFGRGKCDGECVDEIASPFAFYGLAVWGGFIGYLNNRILSAAGRTRDVMVATIIVVVVTIALDVAFVGPLEQGGLALATAIALFINVLVTLMFVRREFPEVDPRGFALQQSRLVLAVAVGVGVALLANLVLPTGEESGWSLVGLLALKAVIAATAYAVALRFIAPREFTETRRTLLAVLRRRRPAQA